MAKSIIEKTPPSQIGYPRVSFDEGAFNALVWQKGYDVTIERAIKCPCQTRDNSALSNCRNCFGTGWVFLQSYKTKAVMQNMNRQTKYSNWSIEMLGTVSISLQESDKLGEMDRITIINDTKNNNTSYISQNLELRDTSENPYVFLSYKPIEIGNVFIYIDENSKLIELNNTEYSIDSANNYILNINLQTLPVNSMISVNYKHEIQYHILDIPHDVRNSFTINSNGREEQTLLPINCIARKAHYVLDTDNRLGTSFIDNTTPLTTDDVYGLGDKLELDAKIVLDRKIVG